MKPGDHPEFFRFPAPEGRSRESTIRLDAEGHFFHDGAPMEHAGLASGMHRWISRHPDDGRYILTNGYDWTYFTVDDAPFFVKSLHVDGSGGGGATHVTLALSDGTEERWDPKRTRIGENGALYATVKASAERGPFEAKFTRHAQGLLEPILVEKDGQPAVKLAGEIVPLGAMRFG